MSRPEPSPRHPASRGRGADLGATVRRVLDRPGAAGTVVHVEGPHRAVALAARAVRGREQRSPAQFAAAYGVGPHLVAAIEAGAVAVEDLPAPLRLLTPMVSVAALGLGAGPPVVGLAGGRAHQGVAVDERLRELVAGE